MKPLEYLAGCHPWFSVIAKKFPSCVLLLVPFHSKTSVLSWNQTGYIGRNEVNQSDLLVKQPQPKLILVNIYYVGSHAIRTVVCVFL